MRTKWDQAPTPKEVEAWRIWNKANNILQSSDISVSEVWKQDDDMIITLQVQGHQEVIRTRFAGIVKANDLPGSFELGWETIQIPKKSPLMQAILRVKKIIYLQTDMDGQLLRWSWI